MSKIRIKTESDIAKLEKGGKFLAEVLFILMEETLLATNKKITAYDLDCLAQKEMKKRGGSPAFLNYQVERGLFFPNAICLSLNNEVVHGLAQKDKIIQGGDLVKIDAGFTYEGLITDSAITVPVGEISLEKRELVQATYEGLVLAIKKLVSGRKSGEFSFFVDNYARKNGFQTPEILGGHGVGYEVHEPPFIPNYGAKQSGFKLEDGMVLALEPMFNQGTGEVVLDKNNFTFLTEDNSLSAHFEHTVAMVSGKAKILTEFSEQNKKRLEDVIYGK